MTTQLPPHVERVKAEAYTGEPNSLRPAGRVFHHYSLPREDSRNLE